MTLNILPLVDIQSPLPKPFTPSISRTYKNPNMLLDNFKINSNLRFVKKIGAGTYGLIYLLEDTITGKQYAAKMILKDPPVKSGNVDANENKKYIQRKIFEYFDFHQQSNQLVCANELDLKFIADQGVHCPFLREIALHLRVHDHPNVITIHKVLNLGGLAIVILMDYFDQGDLFNNIIDNKIFSDCPPHQDQQLLMKNCMLQLVDGLSYCALKSVYHCDLKPENIMLRYNPKYQRHDNHNVVDYNEIHVVLIDFGLAMSSNLICCNACRGSSYYMAPERITNFNTSTIIKSIIDLNQYQTIESPEPSSSKYFPTLAGDIWSLGVLFINITCARNPWPIANINDEKQVFSNYIFHNKSILSTILPISNNFNRLLDSIFALNPNDRISLSQLYIRVLQCEFFLDDHILESPCPSKSDITTPPSKVSLFNSQLYTPPETESESYFLDDEADDDVIDYFGGVSPRQSVIHMEQCDKKVKIFGCPHHHQ